MNNQQLEVRENFHRAIAPHIIANDFIKEVLTLQIFSNPRIGEKIHILIIGDTASGKSEIGDDIVHFVPHSQFSSRRRTEVGIEEKLIFANGGIICIDELDKSPRSVRHSLLEAMAQQRVTIDKHRYHIIKETKVNVLALCNPTTYKLNSVMPLLSQIPFSDDLVFLNRFHLFLPMTKLDSDLYAEVPDSLEISYSNEKRWRELLEFIAEAREIIPKVHISNEILQLSSNFIRSLEHDSRHREIVTLRTREGFLNCIRAYCRLYEKDNAEEEDYKYVRKIYEKLYL